jgi:hypothetical protein
MITRVMNINKVASPAADLHRKYLIKDEDHQLLLAIAQ